MRKQRVSSFARVPFETEAANFLKFDPRPLTPCWRTVALCDGNVCILTHWRDICLLCVVWQYRRRRRPRAHAVQSLYAYKCNTQTPCVGPVPSGRWAASCLARTSALIYTKLYVNERTQSQFQMNSTCITPVALWRRTFIYLMANHLCVYLLWSRGTIDDDDVSILYSYVARQ